MGKVKSFFSFQKLEFYLYKYLTPSNYVLMGTILVSKSQQSKSFFHGMSTLWVMISLSLLLFISYLFTINILFKFGQPVQMNSVYKPYEPINELNQTDIEEFIKSEQQKPSEDVMQRYSKQMKSDMNETLNKIDQFLPP